MELSARWPIKSLCGAMSISRSGYYEWKARLSSPSDRLRKRMADVALFQEYHAKYPSHGYRWLNAKIKLDLGLVMSDQCAHRCRRFAGIKSKSRHYAYKKAGEPKKIHPNAVMASLSIDGPLQCVVSDMTAFWEGGTVSSRSTRTSGTTRSSATASRAGRAIGTPTSRAWRWRPRR